MTVRLAAQLIGFIATGLYLLSFQFKKNRQLFAIQLASFAVFFVHFLMLGALTGCIAMAINAARSVVMYYFNDKKWAAWKGWLYVFFLLYAANSAYTWDGIISLLPFIGSVACLVAYWGRNLRTIRVVNLVLGSPTWLVYDAVTGSIPGMVNEAMCMLSVIISIVRFGWKALDTKD